MSNYIDIFIYFQNYYSEEELYFHNLNMKYKKDDNQADKTDITLVNSNIKMRDSSGYSSNVHDIPSHCPLGSVRVQGGCGVVWCGSPINIPI